jgi:hypothetical protein
MNLKNILATAAMMLAAATTSFADEPLSICHGEYALCAASPTTPTGRMMTVKGKKFREGVAVCPILSGDAVANLNLMHGSCKSAPGKIWSLFGVPTQTSYPQQPTWDVAPATFRSFTIGTTPTTGMSNMWSFPCDIQAQPVNGVKLASCYGPIMESPWTNDHVKSGQIGFTQAAEGVTYPVGGNVSRLDLLGKAVSKTGK